MSEPRSEAETLALNISGLNHEQVTPVLQKLIDERAAKAAEGDWLREQKRNYERLFDAANKRAEAAEAALLQSELELDAMRRRAENAERDSKEARGELRDEKEITGLQSSDLEKRVSALESSVRILASKLATYRGTF